MATKSIDLQSSSQYRNGAIVTFGDGDEILVRDFVDYVPGVGDRFHTIREGDRLDVLAWAKYRQEAADSPKYGWVLADANEIYDPNDIDPLVGTVLLVPNLSRFMLGV